MPRADGRNAQMTTFILLSDVTGTDAPTKVVTLSETRDVPIGTARTKFGDYFDREVSIEGPAGSLMVYKTDVFHRGSNFTAENRARFAILTDFKTREWRWQGKLAWPNYANSPNWKRAMVEFSPRQRDLFGWPPVGDPYWNAQTLSDVALRYPGIDLSPYAEAAGLSAAKADAPAA